MKKIKTRDIAINGILAGLYVIFSLLTYPISFLSIQFRVSEMLILLCFFNPSFTIGLTVGCLITNIFSTIGYVDMAFGTVATLISCLLVSYCKPLLLCIFFPVVINGLLVGLELHLFAEASFWASCLTVAAGELVVVIVGYFILRLFRRKKEFYKLIHAKRNIDFKL